MVCVFALTFSQVCTHSRSGSLDANCSVLKNEAALLASLQQNRLHQPTHYNNQQQHVLSAHRKYLDGPANSTNLAANPGLSASLYNSLNTLLSQTHSRQPPYGNNHGCSRLPPDSLHSFSSRVASQTQRTDNRKSNIHVFVRSSKAQSSSCFFFIQETSACWTTHNLPVPGGQSSQVMDLIRNTTLPPPLSPPSSHLRLTSLLTDKMERREKRRILFTSETHEMSKASCRVDN